LALEHAAREGRACRGDGKPLPGLGEQGFGQGEFHHHLRQVVKPGDDVAGGDPRTAIHLGQPDDPGEGRGDGAFLEPAAGAVKLGAGLGEPGGRILQRGLRNGVRLAQLKGAFQRQALFGDAGAASAKSAR